MQEAWEEAGVLGRAEAAPIGHYDARKLRPPYSWRLMIAAHPLAVERVSDEWPEGKERARRFVTIKEMRRLVDEPALVAMARLLVERDVEGGPSE